MNRELVSSSNLRSVGYSADERVLEIEFHSGGIYQYFGVPQAHHVGLMRAGSKGHYFDSHIKHTYRWRQIR